MNRNSKPELGVHLLETITRGMYSEPMHAIREYVQNAFDSIRAARSEGILGIEDGTVRVTLDVGAKSLCIEDDGIGLGPEQAVVSLLDIGRSEKALDDTRSSRNAGFRGIGRMAGISYCNRLIFETSVGDGRICAINFNAHRINELTRPGQKPISIWDAIDSSVDVNDGESQDDRRFFKVVLEGIAPSTKFLDEGSMKEYLSETAPVRYDPLIWNFGEEIRKMAANVESSSSLDTVKLVICDSDGNEQVDVRRPYNDRFEAKSGRKRRTVKVDNVISLPSSEVPGNGWWGWLAMHRRDATLGDVPFAGLRIRMHNIAVGDERIVRRLFSSPHLALWCFGEVHITDPRIIPNAQRDGFEPSKRWSQIESELREEVAVITKMCRKESKTRSDAKKKHMSRIGADADSSGGDENQFERGNEVSTETITPNENVGIRDEKVGSESTRITGQALQSTDSITPMGSVSPVTQDTENHEDDRVYRSESKLGDNMATHTDRPSRPGHGGVGLGQGGRNGHAEAQQDVSGELDSRLRECFDRIVPVLRDYFEGDELVRLSSTISAILRRGREV